MYQVPAAGFSNTDRLVATCLVVVMIRAGPLIGGRQSRLKLPKFSQPGIQRLNVSTPNVA